MRNTAQVGVRNTQPFRALLLTFGVFGVCAGAGCGTSGVASRAGGGSAVAGAPVARSGGPGTGGSALSNVAGERSGGSGGVTVAGAGTPGAGMPGAGMPGAGSNMGGTASGAAAGAAGSHAAASGSGGSSSLPPHSGTWRITPLGDSITGSTCGPQLLAKALADHGKTNFVFVGSNLNNQSCNGAGTVQTEGHGGYLVTDLVGNGMHAAELPKWCESNRADLVLMQFGTNDVWSDHSPSVILDAYSTVLSDLRAANPNVVVMVAQITPLNPKDCADCEARVVALNAQIPAWASSKTSAASPVSVVDLHAAFVAASYTLNSTYTADGVHPNVAGAQLIAAKWFDALVALGAP